MIDTHCHLLPGFDDGPKTIDESVEMARILADAGFSEVCCTPHLIKGVFDNGPGMVRKAVRDLQFALDEARVSLRLRVGFEYYLDEFLPEFLTDPLTLGNSCCLLIETPVNANFDFVKDSIYELVRKGFVPVLAHPERYTFLDQDGQRSKFKVQGSLNGLLRNILTGINVERRTSNVERFISLEHRTSNVELLLSMGCLFQGNIGSFAGLYGDVVRDNALRLLQSGQYDRLGTDAHKPQKLADWLVRGLKVIEKHIGQDRLKKMISIPIGRMAG
jgi:protein-tyrosine phosphatase